MNRTNSLLKSLAFILLCSLSNRVYSQLDLVKKNAVRMGLVYGGHGGPKISHGYERYLSKNSIVSFNITTNYINSYGFGMGYKHNLFRYKKLQLLAGIDWNFSYYKPINSDKAIKELFLTPSLELRYNMNKNGYLYLNYSYNQILSEDNNYYGGCGNGRALQIGGGFRF